MGTLYLNNQHNISTMTSLAARYTWHYGKLFSTRFTCLGEAVNLFLKIDDIVERVCLYLTNSKDEGKANGLFFPFYWVSQLA